MRMLRLMNARVSSLINFVYYFKESIKFTAIDESTAYFSVDQRKNNEFPETKTGHALASYYSLFGIVGR